MREFVVVFEPRGTWKSSMRQDWSIIEVLDWDRVCNELIVCWSISPGSTTFRSKSFKKRDMGGPYPNTWVSELFSSLKTSMIRGLSLRGGVLKWRIIVIKDWGTVERDLRPPFLCSSLYCSLLYVGRL